MAASAGTSSVSLAGFGSGGKEGEVVVKVKQASITTSNRTLDCVTVHRVTKAVGCDDSAINFYGAAGTTAGLPCIICGMAY